MFQSFPHLLTALVVAIQVILPAYPQDEEGDSIPPEISTQDQVKEIIKKLSSASFSERQQASEELLTIAPEFVSLLEDTAANSTGETQLRLRMILPQLRKRLFEDHLGAFLRQPSIEMAQRLPQWERFEKICGHDDEALIIFGQILSAESRLFATRLFAQRELPRLLETHTAEIAKKCNGKLDEEFPIASVAAVMLLGSEKETRLIRATSTNISSALDDPRFSRLISDGVHSRTLRAIVESWIVREGIAAERPLLFSMQHKLASGRTVAIRIIESNSNRPDMILSLLCLAKLGNVHDLPRIEALLSNETILWPQRGQIVRNVVPGTPPFDTNYKIQTRDVALAAAAELRGISPTDIGIAARPSDVTLFAVDSIGFSSDESRKQSLAAYRKLAAK